MFLALKEIKYEKLRYGLITFMIFLIAFLIFMLASLSTGLASENTQAINSWETNSVVLNKNSNINLAQSVITKQDMKDTTLNNQKQAYVGQTPVVVKHSGDGTVSAQFIGLDYKQYIYKNLDIVEGTKPTKNNEVLADTALKEKGYRLNNEVTFNSSKKKYKIVGFVKNAKINIAPIIYGKLSVWKAIRPMMPNAVASGIISKNSFKLDSTNTKTYDRNTFVKKLPGYMAQNLTFEMMIGFLYVISLIVIAVFLYILTIQKLPNYAVLRAQGIPMKTLIGATLGQSLILVILGTVIAWVVMLIMTKVLPAAVPLDFAPWIMISGFAGMIATGIIGGLIPIRSIMKVDPAKAIG
ncbi:ABC transporter permease [Lactobacillus sp. PV012]|uniref:ABC transporter permease n=1 Tax=Lactobacillus sp. PV012 TaxID=2594494 RepID=UPI00223F04D7|nr:ABC transporter permease [Lactobacillus sp. PV012]QNQ82818.1 ABC transporter permease [Lactobacillus sp. PV012]